MDASMLWSAVCDVESTLPLQYRSADGVGIEGKRCADSVFVDTVFRFAGGGSGEIHAIRFFLTQIKTNKNN